MPRETRIHISRFRNYCMLTRLQPPVISQVARRSGRHGSWKARTGHGGPDEGGAGIGSPARFIRTACSPSLRCRLPKSPFPPDKTGGLAGSRMRACFPGRRGSADQPAGWTNARPHRRPTLAPPLSPPPRNQHAGFAVAKVTATQGITWSAADLAVSKHLPSRRITDATPGAVSSSRISPHRLWLENH